MKSNNQKLSQQTNEKRVKERKTQTPSVNDSVSCFYFTTEFTIKVSYISFIIFKLNNNCY